jgi:hypothetical protein
MRSRFEINAARDWAAELEVRWARQEARELRGLTETQVRNVRKQAAKSATFCACCFRPLMKTDSVTLVDWKINKHDCLQMPICLLCSLDGIEWWPGRYHTPSWHRVRCLNCDRPMRVYGHPPFRPTTCCTDCGQAHRYRRNNQRRRINPEPVICIECGRFPRRADAKTCSNRCRQAQHRKRTSAVASVIRDGKSNNVTHAVTKSSDR